MKGEKNSNIQNHFFELSQDLMCIAGFDGYFKFINPACEKLLGYSEEELLSKPFIKFIHPNDHKKTNEELSGLSKGKTTISFENRYICKDGSTKNIEWTATLQTDGKIIYCIGQDITEQKLTEKALKASEEKYRSLYDNINVGAALHEIVLDSKGKAIDFIFLDVNPTYEKLTTLNKEDVVGKRGRDVIPTLEQKWIDIYGEVALTGKSVSIIDYSDFLNKYWEVKAYSPAKNKFAVALTDITDRILAENKLSLITQRHQLSTKSARIGIWDFNLKKNTLIWDNQMFNLYGIKVTDNNDAFEAWEKGVHPDDVVRTNAEVQEAIANNKELHSKFRIVWPNNQIRHIEAHALIVSDSIENPERMIGVSWDITEQKLAEEALLKSEAKFKDLFLKMINAFALHEMIFNEKGEPIDYKFLEVNPAWEKLIGVNNKMVIGKTIREIMPDIEDRWMQVYGRIVKTGIPEEFNDYNKSTQKYYHIYAYRTEPGKFAVLFNDISERKQAEEALIKAKEKAEESDRLKSAFLANMSHEIRTPLNGILGFTELLVEDGIEAKQKSEMGKIILENGELLLTIINDVLDISKIEAGQIIIKKSKFEISKVINEVANSFKVKAQKKNLDLNIASNNGSYDFVIYSDFIRLKQVLTNLVSNALKYTEKGFVEIGCEHSKTELTFYVADSGIGVVPEQHKKIFERFNRQEAYTKKAGGNGLGLAISKSFVEMLGGEIGVESEEGKGSKFFFTIPLS